MTYHIVLTQTRREKVETVLTRFAEEVISTWHRKTLKETLDKAVENILTIIKEDKVAS